VLNLAAGIEIVRRGGVESAGYVYDDGILSGHPEAVRAVLIFSNCIS